MKIIVTGSCGFVGQHLCQRLVTQGHTVIAHARTQGDLCNEGVLEQYGNADFVYHLAAKTFVPDSWAQPQTFYRDNILSTVSVLEYCRSHRVPLLFMSTYVYGPPQQLPVSETHPVCAMSPYHESKLLGEDLCSFYVRQYGMDIQIFRPFNIYGPGQNMNFLIPKVLSQVLDDNCTEVEVFDLAPKRDYVYIKDLVSALEAALQPSSGLQIYNIGSGVSLSVAEVITITLAAARQQKGYRAAGKTRKGEILDCVADIERAKTGLGFAPQYTFYEGIADWLSTEGPV